MFSTLVPEYDRFNRVSSLGLDVSWRRELVREMVGYDNVLDVGTGTGDVAAALAADGHSVAGVDFSESMITAARQKLDALNRVRFEVASADRLPFQTGSFDGITSAFVIRNLFQGGILPESLREFHRVLRPGGRMVHLELSRPPNGLLSWGHDLYLKSVLPLVGRMIFRNRWPQDYLSSTIRKFPRPQEVCQRVRWAGFDRVSHYALSGGVASLFCAVKC